MSKNSKNNHVNGIYELYKYVSNQYQSNSNENNSNIIKKGKAFVVQIGDPKVRKQKHPLTNSWSAINPKDRELCLEVAKLVNGMVGVVCWQNSLEKNLKLVKEMETFQNECFDIEYNGLKRVLQMRKRKKKRYYDDLRREDKRIELREWDYLSFKNKGQSSLCVSYDNSVEYLNGRLQNIYNNQIDTIKKEKKDKTFGKKFKNE